MHVLSTGFPQQAVFLSGGRQYRGMSWPKVAALAAGGCVVLGAAAAAAQAPAPAPGGVSTFRVFLRDGRVLNSYGECATLPEELVCLVRLGGDGVAESHDVLTVPLTEVDAARTTEYARALRAAQYGATRGEREYAELTTEISRALADLEAATDREQRLGIAQLTRQRLVSWSDEHFGYKAAETRHLIGLLDEVIAELRVAAGQSKFALDLVANPPPVTDTPLLPEPTRIQALEAALEAASVTPVAAERLDLLRSVDRVARSTAGVPPALRARAATALASEQTIERQYRALMTDAIARADVAVRHGRASVMQRLIWEVEESDQKLGARRPREMAAFLRRLEIELALAREQQTAFTRWEQVKDQLLAYEVRLRPLFDRWVSQRRVLAALRDRRVPAPSELDAAQRVFASIDTSLAGMRPLPELQEVHAVLRSATQMARQALVLGQRLTVAANEEIARNASAAMAGAELLLAQGRADLVPALNPRKVR